MKEEKVLFTWSSGKDSALALHRLGEMNGYSVCTLLCTVTREYERVSMHGVREALLDLQAESLGMPLEKVFISSGGSNDEYERSMRQCLVAIKKSGVRTVAYGDIFLEDLRSYREKKLGELDMKAVFPLWGADTTVLARGFIGLGFKAVVICTDSEYLEKSFCGREYDEEFLRDLPPGIDACGENGEFHTFVYDGPIFKTEVPVRRGEIVLRDSRYHFCDLLPR